jgi:hypothetical protein
MTVGASRERAWKIVFVAGLLLIALLRGAGAQPSPLRSVTAVRASTPPDIDGRLDDAVWRDAPAVSGLLQRDPDEGQPESERTEVRVAYDDAAIYIGANLRDSTPAAIVRQLSRRDAAVEADAFVLYLDPHHDGLTGAQFGVSAAGVQRDALIYNDSFLDSTWDAVWESAVAVDEGGWAVEMRIPLSQLRFPRLERYTWGINVQRIIHRRAESDWLRLVRKTDAGLASKMAALEGIVGIDPPSTLEWLPYATTRAEFLEPNPPGTPFNDGSRLFASAGLDLKYGVASNLALTATINPDFGQVEVDPAVVNLTQFETFFEERRPFFVEGARVFASFGRSGASSYTSYFFPEPTLFYSRRIGRTPQGRVSAAYSDVPSATTILGAAKLVGRTKRGWTLGVLDAVTAEEDAKISTGILTSEREVEPLTNYAVFRAQRELGARAGLGVLATSVVRRSDDPTLDAYLPRHATMSGVDGHVFLDAGRTWVLHGGVAGSWVSGSKTSMARLQRAEQRYYQRPDAPHVSFNPSATDLSGWFGQAFLNKNSGPVTVNFGVWGMSPGFEVNDAGYSTQTDRAGGHAMVQFRRLTPDRWTRERSWWVSKWWTWNYGRESQGDGWQTGGSFLFRNFWRGTALLSYARRVWDDKLTRGGPTVIRPGNRGAQVGLVTDTRRTLALSLSGSHTSRDYHAWNTIGDAQLVWRPAPALTVTAGPSVRRNVVAAQYLSTVVDPLATATYGGRFVFGELVQNEVSMVARVNLATSPHTSLQVYMQPLVSAGDYGAIKEVAAPRTFDFVRYGIDAGSISDVGNSLVIDPDASGPASPFAIAQPDFTIRSMRLNAIFRWEFRPGSALFFVYTQQRQDRGASGDFHLGPDLDHLWNAPTDDVVMVKATYWFGMRGRN